MWGNIYYQINTGITFVELINSEKCFDYGD